jgi:ribonuclease HI
MEVTVYTDGASRGNPGPAAIAYLIRGDGVAPVDYCEAIGTATNNFAEYSAMIRALEAASRLGARRVALHSDSELMVRQMNGEYRVKHPDIVPLYEEARECVATFDAVQFIHIPRSQNAEADRLCNLALDGAPKSRPAAVRPADDHDGDDVPAPPGVVALLEWARGVWASDKAGELPPAEVWRQLHALLHAPAPAARKPARRRVRQK